MRQKTITEATNQNSLNKALIQEKIYDQQPQVAETIMEKFIENSDPNAPKHELEQVITPMQRLNSLLSQVLKIFVVMRNQVKKHAKFAAYLADLGLTQESLQGSLDRIMNCLGDLNVKAQQGEVYLDSIIKICTFLKEFVREDLLATLEGKELLVWILEVETKISFSLQFMHALNDQRDITNSPKDYYEATWRRILINPLGEQEAAAGYKFLKKMLFITTAASIKEEEFELSLFRKTCFGCSFPRYLLAADDCKLQSFKFYRQPTIQLAQKIWNIPECGATKQLAKIAYQRITTNIKLYIPTILKEEKPEIFEENGQCITVRLLYHKKLKFVSRHKPAPSESQFISDAIIHMHGGGFIALSSRSMQSYTRKWANALQVPVFSIDYRMPPEHPFPTAPFDCLKVYRFITEHIHEYVNIRPKNIYLAGDSAGGNLACSLAGLVLRDKLPLPKGLYVLYPALDLQIAYSASRLHALTDPLLWPSMLLLCLASYLKNSTQECMNPLASPLLLTEEWVGGQVADTRFPLRWPRTMVATGMKDPLLDDTLRFMHKLLQSNIECRCHLYEHFSHGFMNTDAFMSVCEKLVDNSISQLRTLMNPSETL